LLLLVVLVLLVFLILIVVLFLVVRSFAVISFSLLDFGLLDYSLARTCGMLTRKRLIVRNCLSNWYQVEDMYAFYFVSQYHSCC
jgi:hypothetical protein